MPVPSDGRDVDEDAELARRIAELRAAGVELVAGTVTDLAGVTRAKYVPLRRLAAFQHAGMGVSPSWSVFCVDSGIAFTPDIGVVGDLRIRIDPVNLRQVDDGGAWGARGLQHPQGDTADITVAQLVAFEIEGAAVQEIGAHLQFAAVERVARAAAKAAAQIAAGVSPQLDLVAVGRRV